MAHSEHADTEDAPVVSRLIFPAGQKRQESAASSSTYFPTGQSEQVGDAKLLKRPALQSEQIADADPLYLPAG